MNQTDRTSDRSGEELVAKTPPDDDMLAPDDVASLPDDLERWSDLRDYLAACNNAVAAPFAKADAAAINAQRHHRIITLIAACCGTVAVSFAILQLSRLFGFSWLPAVEIAAAVIALAAVFLGLIAAQQARWLFERHKAERFRLAKFRYLIDPLIWSVDNAASARRTKRFRDEIKSLEAITPRELHHWTDEDEVPMMPEIPEGVAISPQALRQLVDYYATRRLGVQIKFFSERVRGNARMDGSSRHLGPILFFASVTAALAHFVYHLVFRTRELDTANVLLIVMAAILPVLGAGIRTIRSAHEFTRNTIRYRSKLIALRHFSERLRPETDSNMVWRDLWCCEQVLESEQREWLRLMIEADWYG